MATALQRQLAAIASTSSNELDLKAQRSAHSKSLLFDQNVAASQSFDLLWQICSEGFEDLCALDARFLRYSRTIFSPQSRSEDRALMNASHNAELDAVLESFLRLVGSRLLLRPALKAVEWLVRRFRIHELNSEALIMTFLPYFNTNIFVALLSILPSKLPTAFKFLHTYIHSVSNPPQAILVYTASHNPGFFSALNRYTLSVAREKNQHTALLALWASVVGQTVNEKLSLSKSGRDSVQRQREEDFLLDILPTINEGLSLKKSSEVVLASYMITVILVGKADLDEHTLDAFLETVVSSWTADTFETGLACAAAIAERKHGLHFPQKVVKLAFRFPRLGSSLVDLSIHQNVQPFVIGLLRAAAKNVKYGAQFDIANFVKPLLDNKSISDSGLVELKQLTNSAHVDDFGRAQIQDLVLQLRDKDSQHKTGDHLEIDTETAPAEGDDIEYEDAPETPDADLEHFPDDIEEASFLLPEATSLFREVSNAFVHVLHRTEKKKAFFDLPLWRKSGVFSHALFLSFLTRVWSTSIAAHVRLQAIETTRKHLESQAIEGFDIVAMVPYLFTALADESRLVRKSAVDLAVHFTAMAKMQAMEGGYLYFDVFGGYSNKHARLLPRTLSLFMSRYLEPQLEECISNSDHIGIILSKALSGPADDSIQDRPDGKEKRLKSVQKIEVMTFLSYHIGIAPSPKVKTRLIQACNRVDRICGTPRSQYLIEHLKAWLSPSQTLLDLCKEERLSLPEVDAIMLRVIHPADQTAMDFLLALARGVETSDRVETQRAAFAQIKALWPALRHTAKENLARDMLDLVAVKHSGERTETASAEANDLLRNLQLSADTQAALLDYSTDEADITRLASTKRRRVDDGSAQAVDMFDGDPDREPRDIARLTLAVELVDASGAGAHLKLFYALFGVLVYGQQYKQENSSNLEFHQLVTVGNLLAISNALTNLDRDPGIDSTLAREDVLVDLLRRTNNPQIRNSGLLLLRNMTMFMPEAVLQSVIPIFTLIGASAVSDTDEFSAHVVDETIQKVIPRLVTALKEKRRDLITAMADIVSSFAAALIHIAPARRLKLFTLLTQSLGVDDSLCAVIATVMDRHPRNGTAASFCAQLVSQFGVLEGLTTMVKYLDIIRSCRLPGNSTYKAMLQNLETQAQQDETAKSLLAAAPIFINDGVVSERVAAELEDEEAAVAIRQSFAELLERALSLSKDFAEHAEMRTTCSKLVENTLKLVPFKNFTQAIEPLVDHRNPTSQGVLKAFEGQLRAQKQVKNEDRKAALKFLPRIAAILEDDSATTLRLNALVCIDLVCENFGKLDRAAVFDVAQIIAEPKCLKSDDITVRSISLHCLASIVEVLESEFIPLLNVSFDAVCDNLSKSLRGTSRDKKLHTAAFALAGSIVEQLAYMIPTTALRQILELSGDSANNPNLSKVCEESRTQFLEAVASKLDVQHVVEALRFTWLSALTKGPRALREHLKLLSAAIDAAPKSVVSKQPRPLLDSFLTFFDLHRGVASERVAGIYTQAQLHEAEVSTLNALLALILKINDAAFRPFFVRMVEWADTAPKSEEAGKALRWTTLLNFLTAISDRLKSLVTSYFAHVLDFTTNTLVSSATGKAASSALQQSQERLVMAALAALTSSLRHDTTDFYAAPARFNQIHPALLAPLAHHNPTPANSLSRTHIIPAVVALAACVSGNQAHLVTLQTAMLDALLKYNTGAREGQTPQMQGRARLAGVMAMRAVGQQVGEEWLAELPRMLPVVSELLEDGDERIERETEGWVKEMELVLGESIEDML